jgi:hypothetical chaperone protein
MRHSKTHSLGIDFGTTNTVVALADQEGNTESIKFEFGGEVLRLYMSVICFWEEKQQGVRQTRVEGGPWAIQEFLDGLDSHRFMQSFKSYAASRSFQDTTIFRRKYQFEDLLAAFLRTLWRHTGTNLTDHSGPVIIGRPVRFVGRNPDEALAMNRYRKSFSRLGLDDGKYVYEPVGAAFFFAQRLAADALVLVADFGGGTSDFSIIRFIRSGNHFKPQPLGNAGIGIAGDAFDYRIIQQVVAPKLGKGGQYNSFGKLLTIPNGYYANLARWNQLAMMKSSGELTDLMRLTRMAIDPEPLHKFIELIEHDLAMSLYRAVSGAKIALSSQDAVEFVFQRGTIDIRTQIRRADFEHWISRDISAIAGTVEKALEDAGVTANQIDRVFLTGGSSFIPAVKKVFTERFAEGKIEWGDQFESIAQGLALIGQTDDPSAWIVDEA